jgi:DNA-binding PadR family transcriptional regulator
MSARRSPESFLPLKPRVLLILMMLVDGPRHGYALKEELLRRTDGKVNLGPGTLYRTLHGLVAEGLIEESEERPDREGDDVRRIYYEITALGRSVVTAEAERLSGIVKLARKQHLIP